MRPTSKVFSVLFAGLALSGFLAGCSGSASGENVNSGKVDVFAKSVLPIVSTACAGQGCHSPGGPGTKDFTVSASSSQTYLSLSALVTPGNPSGSKLYSSMGMNYLPAPAWEFLSQWIADGAVQYGADMGGPPPLPQAQAVGIRDCADYCHTLQAKRWLLGPHANSETFLPANGTFEDRGLSNQGFPTVEMLGAADCTYLCHDQLGDGRTGLTLGHTGDRPRPVVGCESCHGGGSLHIDKPSVAIPYATVDANRCGTCHNEQPSLFGAHDLYHPEAKNLKAKHLAGPHAKSLNENVMASVTVEGQTVLSATDVRARCSRCHSDEGARSYGFVGADYASVTGSIASTASALANASPIECRTCHLVHQERTLLGAATAQASAEYNTCVFCHAAADAYHGAKNSYSWELAAQDVAVEGQAGLFDKYVYSGEEILYDTHADDPATPTKIEGYVVRPKSERACRECHDVHDSRMDLNRQWAESSHGGKLLLAKEYAALTQAAVPADAKPGEQNLVPPVIGAGAVGTSTGVAGQVVSASARYDWDSTIKADTTATSATFGKWIVDRGQCQECHTATGFMNFMDALRGGQTYDFLQNDFSHLAGWQKGTGALLAATSTGAAPVVSGQNELIYCWSCHTDNAGGLRTAGGQKLNNYASGNTNVYTVFATLPDIGKSNICVKCHGGRASGTAIAATPAGSRSTRFSGHHAVAAATVFAEDAHIAYEFPGLDYSMPEVEAGESLPHDRIAVAGAEKAGPCVSCHMAGKNHTLAALDEEEGKIPAQALCDSCHTAPGIGFDELLEYEEGYEAALAVFEAALTAKGYNPDPATAIANATQANLRAAADVRDYGSFVNYIYLANEDKAAFIHNPRYARRLIIDSLAWLKDGMATGTVDLSAHPEAAAWLDPLNPPALVTRP